MNSALTILIAVTSHAQLGNTGRPTGAYLGEITHAYEVFRRAGYQVAFTSPKGGKIPLDGVDREDLINRKWLDDRAFLDGLEKTIPSADVKAERYAAIYFAGGHGTMWDFPNDAALAKVTAKIYEQGGVVSAVCHGPAGLVNVKLSDGKYLVAGKELAAFTDEEERGAKLENIVPFMLASTLVERGAKHIPAPNWQKNVVVSGRLVTGQNPASASGVGEAVVKVLAASAR